MLIKRTVLDFFDLLKASYAERTNDNAPRLGAALSYYTIFSLAPLLLIAIALPGAIAGREALEGRAIE